MKQLPTTIASVECDGYPPHDKSAIFFNNILSIILFYLFFLAIALLFCDSIKLITMFLFSDELPSESAGGVRSKFDLAEVEDNASALDAASGGGADASNKRVPLDTLAKLFPQTKRATLKSTLDRCDGDVLRAIEQLVYHNNNPQPESSTNAANNTEGGGAPAQHKRKSSNDHSGREKPVPRYSHHHHHQHAEPTPIQWKNYQSAVGNAFPNSGAMSGSSARTPIFPAPIQLLPRSFRLRNNQFSGRKFPPAGLPVFPGMNLLAAAGGSTQGGSLEPISPAAYAAAYPSTPNVVLHHSSSSPGVKQESELNVMMSENQSSSPRSDRSERSPYSD